MPAREISALTRREHEVALLVAQGLTNRQIAERLFLSERTAEHHVEQIRGKLGFHSRAQIAAWVAAAAQPEAAPVGELAPAAAEHGPAAAPSSMEAKPVRPRRRLWLIALAAAVLASAGLLAVIFWTQAQGPSLSIQTVAGTGRADFSADGALATATDLTQPSALAVDQGGSVYFIDGNRVRVITRQGTIKTIAGTGDAGYGGDGGPAVLAELNAPAALAIDPEGNVFIADTANNRIRKVDRAGRITSVAGTGDTGFSGDGQAAVTARLNSPTGLAIGFGGTLYIADTLNNRVRSVAGGLIATVAGTGAAAYTFDGVPATATPLNLPEGLAVDSEGSLYIDDTGNDRVRRVNLTDEIATVAGSGDTGFSGDGRLATAAELSLATEGFQGGQALAVDSEGNLYIADAGNQRVRKVDLRGDITTMVGSGLVGFSGDGEPPLRADLDAPLSVAVDARGILYLADSKNHRIREIFPRR